MEPVGLNIVKMEEMIQTPLVPPPAWIRRWQLEAEHLLFLAHMARDAADIPKLRELDAAAATMVATREAKLAASRTKKTPAVRNSGGGSAGGGSIGSSGPE